MSSNSHQIPEVLLSVPEVQVESIVSDNQQFLVFEFCNHFSKQAAKDACDVWTAFHVNQQKSAIHIWNCRRMSGFDMGAKKVWMNKMKEFGPLIERIVLVSDMILIRGAARLMSKFSSHPLAVYKSVQEMQEKEGLALYPEVTPV